MAATKISVAALDAQLNYIVTNSERLLLVPSYVRSQTYATVSGAAIAESSSPSFGTIVNDTSGPTDDADAPSRRLPVNSIDLDAATGTNTEGTDLALVLVDDTGSEILAVTDETTDRAVAIDDVITTFAFFIQASQPSQV